MSGNFTPEQVKHVARLAALNMDEASIPTVCAALSKTFQLIAQLQEVDTTDVAPMCHPLDAKQLLRADEVTEHDLRDVLLAGAPATEAGLILVPKVIE